MARSPIHRIGFGTDLHRLESGRKLILGGVEIPWEKGLAGHSDADVVLHALTDAMLGAAGLPDIGEMFPDSDAAYRDADSANLLRLAYERVRASGWVVVNADIVIHAERPKLSGYKAAIAERIRQLVGLDAGCVNVKAKTNEGVDSIGRGEAIGCTCVVGLSAVGPKPH